METTIKKFRKGQRVIYNPTKGSTYAPSGWREGIHATIVDSKNLLVQFDENVYGHTGDDTGDAKLRVPEGTGWYVNADQLTIIPKVKQPKKQVDPLAEFFDILSALPEDELKDLLGEAKSRQHKVDAEKYYKFKGGLTLDTSVANDNPLYIRCGLASSPEMRFREIGIGNHGTLVMEDGTRIAIGHSDYLIFEK